MGQVDRVQHREWPGLFISFEGGDGVGKSTQIRLLQETLIQDDHEVITTREPGGSLGAEEIRALLVTGEADRWSALTEALLMYASRSDHLEKTIIPALKRGAIVLCDRFSDSSMAYQGIAGALGRETVEQLHDIVVGKCMPDITFILSFLGNTGLGDIGSGDIGLARSKERKDEEQRFEDKGGDFQANVYKAFQEIVLLNPQRCVSVDAGDDRQIVARKILSVLNNRYDLTPNAICGVHDE